MRVRILVSHVIRARMRLTRKPLYGLPPAVKPSDGDIVMQLLAPSCEELDGHGVIVAWPGLTFFVKFKIEGMLKGGTQLPGSRPLKIVTSVPGARFAM